MAWATIEKKRDYDRKWQAAYRAASKENAYKVREAVKISAQKRRKLYGGLKGLKLIDREQYDKIIRNSIEYFKTPKGREYHKNLLKKYSKNLSDYYVIKQLTKDGIPTAVVRNNTELIELKRLTILIKRQLNLTKHGINQKHEVAN